MENRYLVTFLSPLSFFCVSPSMANECRKSKQHPNGANSIASLTQTGEFFLVTGADLHNLGADLIGKKIIFRGYIKKIKRFPTKSVLILSEDKCYYLHMPWGSIGDISDDLKIHFEKNAFRAAGGIINKYKGDKITLWATIDRLMPESGINKIILKYKCCVATPIEKWKHGWTE
jgi:hypothetical protein